MDSRWSNRQLYLVPQFFADKPIEHLLGHGIRAEALNDDCLGRTLDWLYAHNVTTLFAGLALRARRAFGVTIDRLHADTTSFAVHGQYESPPPEAESPASATEEPVETGDHDLPTIIEVTYGYSREHRADLKQWMLALITSGEGVPQFLRPLDGQESSKRSLTSRCARARPCNGSASGETPGVYVADSGIYSCQNMTTLNTAGVRLREPCARNHDAGPRSLVREEPSAWQANAEGTRHWRSRVVDLRKAKRTVDRGPRRRKAWSERESPVPRQAERDLVSWTKRFWHLGNTTFACQADARLGPSQGSAAPPRMDAGADRGQGDLQTGQAWTPPQRRGALDPRLAASGNGHTPARRHRSGGIPTRGLYHRDQPAMA
jgi:hypothetical protein